MKKTLIAMCCLLGLGLTTMLPAKAQDFKKEQIHLSVGYGVGTFSGINYAIDQGYEDYTSSSTGPIYGKVEYGIGDRIGMGMNIAWVQHEYSYLYGSGNQYKESDVFTSLSVLLRVNMHFGKSEHFDPYCGVGLGYRTGTWTYSSTNPDGTTNTDQYSDLFPFGFETTIGFRYHLTNNFGFYMETGIAKSALQFGITQRF